MIILPELQNGMQPAKIRNRALPECHYHQDVTFFIQFISRSQVRYKRFYVSE